MQRGSGSFPPNTSNLHSLASVHTQRNREDSDSRFVRSLMRTFGANWNHAFIMHSSAILKVLSIVIINVNSFKDALGIGFIDLCRHHYDAVLMNPPFGENCPSVDQLLATHYVQAKNDIYAAFVIRGTQLVSRERGAVGALTSRSFFSGRDHRHYRRRLLSSPMVALDLLLDLGSRVLDSAFVETAAYIVQSVVQSELTFIDVKDRAHPGALASGIHKASTTVDPSCQQFLNLPE